MNDNYQLTWLITKLRVDLEDIVIFYSINTLCYESYDGTYIVIMLVN